MNSGPCAMTPEEARAHYDACARSYNLSCHCHLTDIPQVVDAVQLQPSDVVLDLGTGTGWVAQQVAPRCTLVVGLDISPNMIEIAKADSQYTNTHFGVANMLDAAAVKNVVTPLVYSTANIVRLSQVGMPFPFPPVPRFNVVFLCGVFNHVHATQQPAFLQMIHDDLLVPGGRLVLCHESSRDEMYTMEVSYHWKQLDLGYIMASWGRRRVAGSEAETFARDEMVAMATTAGFTTESTVVLNGDTSSGYEDRTADIVHRAQEMFPDTPHPGFDELEAARGEMFDQIKTEFENSREFPRTGMRYQVEEGPRSYARYKAATVIGVFRSTERAVQPLLP